MYEFAGLVPDLWFERMCDKVIVVFLQEEKVCQVHPSKRKLKKPEVKMEVLPKKIGISFGIGRSFRELAVIHLELLQG